MSTTSDLSYEHGARFAFGDNYAPFLDILDEARIKQAEQSLQSMLEVSNISEKRFLDIGSGSGLFSLAAQRLRASVHSFDFDPQSVACTAVLKQRYFANDTDWVVAQGSDLDSDYLSSLGEFEVVYSWGCCITLVPCG